MIISFLYNHLTLCKVKSAWRRVDTTTTLAGNIFPGKFICPWKRRATARCCCGRRYQRRFQLHPTAQTSKSITNCSNLGRETQSITDKRCGVIPQSITEKRCGIIPQSITDKRCGVIPQSITYKRCWVIPQSITDKGCGVIPHRVHR